MVIDGEVHRDSVEIVDRLHTLMQHDGLAPAPRWVCVPACVLGSLARWYRTRIESNLFLQRPGREQVAGFHWRAPYQAFQPKHIQNTFRIVAGVCLTEVERAISICAKYIYKCEHVITITRHLTTLSRRAISRIGSSWPRGILGPPSCTWYVTIWCSFSWVIFEDVFSFSCPSIFSKRVPLFILGDGFKLRSTSGFL